MATFTTTGTIPKLPVSFNAVQSKTSEISRMQDNVVKTLNPVLTFLNTIFPTTAASVVNMAPAFNAAGGITKGSRICLGPYYFTTSSTGVATVTLTASYVLPPFSGSIAGISVVQLTGGAGDVITTGTLTAVAMINNAYTSVSATIQTGSGAALNVYQPGAVTFKAGSSGLLSIQYNTNGSYGPTGTYTASLWVYC